MHRFLKFIFGIKFYIFRTVPLSIIRSFSLYTRQWYMSYSFCEQDQDGTPSWSCSQAVSKPVWHMPLLYVQWKNPDDGQRNCPKHVEFYSKNKFEELVHLVGFILGKQKIYLAVLRVLSSEVLKLFLLHLLPEYLIQTCVAWIVSQLLTIPK